MLSDQCRQRLSRSDRSDRETGKETARLTSFLARSNLLTRPVFCACYLTIFSLGQGPPHHINRHLSSHLLSSRVVSCRVLCYVSPKQESPVGVCDFPELAVLPVPRVGRPAANHHGRLEEPRQAGQVFVVDQPGVGVDAVRPDLTRRPRRVKCNTSCMRMYAEGTRGGAGGRGREKGIG